MADKGLEQDLLIWTYAWELGRRAKGKAKGPVVLRVWRAMPLDLRKNLNVETIWDARNRLLGHLRAFIEAVDAGQTSKGPPKQV